MLTIDVLALKRKTSAPGLSGSNQARIYFDGAGLLLSINGGAYGALASGGGGSTQPFDDNAVLVRNAADHSKGVIFAASSISTGTTRTITVPDVNDTMVVLAATQTLTNKTLTTPTIASFTNAAHDHTNAAGGAQLTISAFSSTTGSGAVVGANTPTLITPVIGVATATSVNKVAITAPATSATLTLADGSTLVTSGANSITLTSTGPTNVTLPTTGTLVNSAVTTLSSLVSVGTITTGTWSATAISLAKGGTGADLSAVAKGGIIAGTGSGTIGITAVGTDGQVLTADAASTGGVKWATGAGSGATTALDNLASVAINASLLAGTTNSIDLGSAGKFWRDSYIARNATFGIAGTATGTLILANATGANTTKIAPGVSAPDLTYVWPVDTPGNGEQLTAAISGTTVTLTWEAAGGSAGAPTADWSTLFAFMGA